MLSDIKKNSLHAKRQSVTGAPAVEPMQQREHEEQNNVAFVSRADEVPALTTHNIETEQCLIAIALVEPQVVTLCHSDDFWVEDNRVIWAAIKSLDNEGGQIDPVIISNKIIATEHRNLFDYIVSLMANEPPVESAEAYAAEIKRYAFNRKLERFARETKGLSLALGGPDTKLSMATSMMNKLIDEVETHRGPVHISAAALEAVTEVEQAAATGTTGVLTKFDGLDDICNGLNPGELIILAGRPAMGKTSLAMNIAENIAEGFIEKNEMRSVDDKESIVLVFSLEMSDKDLSKRVTASRANIDSKLMRTGQMDEYQWGLVSEVVNKMANLNIYIDDKAGVDMGYISSVIRLMSRKYKIALVILDYLQLIKGPTGRAYDDVTDTSRNLKKAAKDFGVPVIALSQLSREVEKRADKRPMPSDLRESGAIEQDADMIWFVYRDDVYHNDSPFPGMAEVIVGKNRSGSTGTAMLTFIKNATRFQNPSQDFDFSVMG